MDTIGSLITGGAVTIPATVVVVGTIAVGAMHDAVLEVKETIKKRLILT